MNILKEADQVTAVDRNKYYGHPAINHALTAKFWQTYMDELKRQNKALDALAICDLNILQKIARGMNTRKRDNDVDIAGYARNKEMIDEFHERNHKKNP